LWARDLARLAKRLDSTLKHFKTLSEVADKIGLSYERYISHATEKCIEDFYYWEGHGGFPRPNQLYSEGVIEKMMDVAEQWQKIDKTTRNRETYENPANSQGG
jgi:hypothetical protein